METRRYCSTTTAPDDNTMSNSSSCPAHSGRVLLVLVASGRYDWVETTVPQERMPPRQSFAATIGQPANHNSGNRAQYLTDLTYNPQYVGSRPEHLDINPDGTEGGVMDMANQQHTAASVRATAIGAMSNNLERIDRHFAGTEQPGVMADSQWPPQVGHRFAAHLEQSTTSSICQHGSPPRRGRPASRDSGVTSRRSTGAASFSTWVDVGEVSVASQGSRHGSSPSRRT